MLCMATAKRARQVKIPVHLQVKEEDLKDFVNERVIEFKKLRGPVIFTDSLPRTALGKLKRRDMKAWAMENAKK